MQNPSIVALLLSVTGTLAAKAPPPEPQSNPLIDHVMGLVADVMGASTDLAKDAGGLILAAPRFGVDVYLWAVGHLRSVPSIVTKVYAGDAAELDKMTDFCVYAAGVIFTVYASVTALNLVLTLFATVKDYFSNYLVIPTSVLGQKLPEPLMQARNLVQAHVLDRVRAFKVGSWIIPLENQGTGAPTLKGATASLATAVSACMILSCAPAVHALMKGGANKGAAEDLAYTLGTALGVQYLVKLTA